MNLIRKLFWIAVFLAATFLWVVLFEHGPSGFKEGINKEWKNLQSLAKPVDRGADSSDTGAR